MFGDPLTIDIGGGTLFQVLASTGDTATKWRVPVLYGGQAASAEVVIGSASTPVDGRTEVDGTGGTVSLAITYADDPAAKFGANPYQQADTRDGFPVKTEILDGRQFSFTGFELPVAVPISLQLNVDAAGARVQLVVDDGAVEFLPQGASTRTVTGSSVGFFVTIDDPDVAVSIVWQYDTPTAHWPLLGSDDTVPLGLLGASSGCLIESRSATDDQVVGVLRAADKGLTASWVAAQDPLPGGWTPQVNDVYLGAGDLDGDGNAEALVVSKEPILGGRVGVLRYDKATDGLITVAVTKDVIVGGWSIDVLDTWVPVGAIDPSGRDWLLVQSQFDGRGGDGFVGLVTYDAALPGLSAASIAKDGIPGGWTISQFCSYTGSDTDGYIAAGDIDGDGLAEIVAWTRSPESDRAFAVLDYDAALSGLKTAWIVKDTVPGDPGQPRWTLDAADNAISAGAIMDRAQPGVLLQRTSPLLPPALAYIRFDPDSRGTVSWLGTGTLGTWQLSPTDLLLPLGDVDGDGRAELLIRDQPLDGPCSLALLRYDEKGGITADKKIVDSIDGWTLAADDAFTALGDIDGDGRTEILLRDTGADGPNHAALLRWDPTGSALTITWKVTGTIPGQLP